MPDYLTMVGALMVVFLVVVIAMAIVMACYELISYLRSKVE